MGVIDGFDATWSQARQTYGEGTPTTGEKFDQSSTLNNLKSTMDGAAPGSRWSGGASEAYGAANTEHQRVIGAIGDLDKQLGTQVTNAANLVNSGRNDLDSVKKWVHDAAATTQNNQAGERMKMTIVSRGLGQLTEVINNTDGQMQKVKGEIDKIKGEYEALGTGQKFSKEGQGDADPLGEDAGDEKDDEIKRRAEEDVRKTLEGDAEAAGRVDEVLQGVQPYQDLSPEEAAYLHQMQAQQKDMSIQEIHAAEQQLGENKNVIGDSWQLMSNDDVKYDNPDKPGEQVVGGRDQLPTHVQSTMGIGTIADDFNRTGETEVKNMAEIIGDGRVELQTGTEVDRGMIELSDRLMDNPTPTNQQAVQDIFNSAGRDHQIITDQLMGRNEGSRDGFLQDVNTIDWSDGGKSAGELFSWTHETTGPDAAIAAQAADQYADYIGRHPELLHMADFGNETLGQRNPELVQAYAHGLTPYMADIAGVEGENRFPDLDDGNPDRPLAKNLFAVLGTDRDAYVEFNGAADQLGLDKAHSWAEDVKNGRMPLAEDARMGDAAVLKGLVADGTATGVEAMNLNRDDALEWRKSAYDAGVIALSAAAGPVGGPAIEIFGAGMQSSVLGDPIGTAGTNPSNISPDEASRYVANALLASGMDLDVDEHYLYEGHVASTEELNQKGGIELPGTTLNESLSRALGPVLGASNPTTNFQFWYNHTISGS